MTTPQASLDLNASLASEEAAAAKEEEAALAKQFLQEIVDKQGDLAAIIVLSEYLIQRKKLNKAYLLILNGLKIHYKDPTLWSLLYLTLN